jgi:hypothetical protein
MLGVRRQFRTLLRAISTLPRTHLSHHSSYSLSFATVTYNNAVVGVEQQERQKHGVDNYGSRYTTCSTIYAYSQVPSTYCLYRAATLLAHA